MWDVTYFVAFANADDVAEIVLDDAEVIAVVVDVGRQQQSVATPHDALLAQIGRAPVDFQAQLVSLYDLRWLRKPLAKLRQESDVSVRRRLVVDERGVGNLTRPPLGGAGNERERARIVPRLLSGKRRREHCSGRTSGVQPHGRKLVAVESAVPGKTG